MTAEEALLPLRVRGARFVSGNVGTGAQDCRARPGRIAAGPEPFAIVVRYSGAGVP